MEAGLMLMMMLWPGAMAASDANLAAMENGGGGGCVYTFHAWVPSQDVVKRLRDLEYKCSNTTHEWERYISNMRSQVLEELLSHKNITYYVERELLEQKLEDVNLKIALKDLKLELVDIRGENTEIRTLIDEMDLSEGHRLRHKAVSNGDYHSLKGELQSLDTSVGQLRNSVGDLKAEWVLIKREVQNIQTSNSRIHQEQDNIKSDTVKTKRILDEVQTDTNVLKSQHEEMRNVHEKLSRSLSEIRNGGSGRGQQLDDNEAHERLTRQMADLKSQNMVLQNQIERIRGENQQLKKEVLAVAVAARNVSHDEISMWLRQLPSISQPTGYTGRREKDDHPRDCQEVFESGFRTSGVYQIKPRGASQLDNAFCEMVNNTGWTLLQRRVDGLLSFQRRWLEYKFGFGNLYGEFWIGTETIHQLTSQKQCRVRIDIWDWEGVRTYAEYSYFKVDSEKDKYTLHVRGYEGTAGDSLSYHDEMAFSTEDSDNDLHMRNCASENKAGWWFNSCYTSNLNGVYHTGWYSHGSQQYADGMVWFTHKESEFYSLKKVEIKIRPTYL